MAGINYKLQRTLLLATSRLADRLNLSGWPPVGMNLSMNGTTVSDALVENYLEHDGHARAVELMTELLVRKLNQNGTRLSSGQCAKIRRWVQGGCESKLMLRIPGRKMIDVTPSKRELRRLGGKARALAHQKAQVAVSVLLETMPPRLLRQLKRNWPKHDARNQRMLSAFENRLCRTWKRALRCLGMLTSLAEELGSEVNADARDVVAEKNINLVEALTRLHARACRIANEILLLLKSGYADGAIARWRSLHEVIVVMLFLERRGDEMAKRYLDHASIDSCKTARFYQKHAARLGHDPMTDAELCELEEGRVTLIRKYGKAFDTDYGWAADALGNSHPSFTDIEASVDLAHWRPHYRLASHNVHAHSKGVLFQLGLPNTDMLLAGPSDAGLAEPGQNMAISIIQASAIIVQLGPTLDRLCTVQAMGLILDECFQAFSRARKDSPETAIM